MVNLDFEDFREERERARKEEAHQRAAGNFQPFYVRRIGAWGAYTPAAQVYFGRWGVYHGLTDLNSSSPDWTRLGTFWRFGKACRVAQALRRAHNDGIRIGWQRASSAEAKP